MGRPSDYTPEMAELICEMLADGHGLKTICDRDGMPSRSTFRRWLVQVPELRAMYARAREDQADTLADQIADIADDTDEDANSRRVRVDARKWIAAKLRPGTYGDKIDHNVKGSLTVTIQGADADL